jgi:hypothetical protein
MAFGLMKPILTGTHYFLFSPFCIGYLFYAFYMFIFFLRKKERYKLPFGSECVLTVFLIVLSFLTFPVILGIPYGKTDRLELMALIETWVVFGCAQLIPSKQNAQENTTIRMFIRLGLMFAYFVILSVGGSFAWR